jgi:hypothetical protein
MERGGNLRESAIRLKFEVIHTQESILPIDPHHGRYRHSPKVIISYHYHLTALEIMYLQTPIRDTQAEISLATINKRRIKVISVISADVVFYNRCCREMYLSKKPVY